MFFLLWLLPLNATSAIERWGLVPAFWIDGIQWVDLLTVATSMFLHVDLWHVAGNVVFLYFFGRLVESRLGASRFLTLYALSGLVAALSQIGVDPFSTIPMVGASGAISGVLGAAVLLAPRERLTLWTPFTLFIPVTLTLFSFGALYLTLQFFGVLVGGTSIAFWAHIGGFSAGWLTTPFLRQIERGSTACNRPKSSSKQRRNGARPGPAPGRGYRTYSVTDATGRTYLFHESV